MVPVNVAALFSSIPAWFTHAPADGLTLPDFVVPGFLFSLGLSAALSFRSRAAEHGFGRTLLHALVRYAVLFAFGSIGILLVDHSNRWEVLQMLGATGLLSFFFLPLPAWPRMGAAVLLLAAVEVLRPFGLDSLMNAWYDTGLAGPWGTFSLAFFPIVASSVGELVEDRGPDARFAIAGLFAVILGAAGLLALPLHPFSKHALSLSYILFTAGVSCGTLAVLVAITEIGGLKLPLLGGMGRNALVLYMLHAVIGVGVPAILPADSSAAAAWSASFAVLAVCAAAARVLDWKRISIKL
jgi:predicted acyltransferase